LFAKIEKNAYFQKISVSSQKEKLFYDVFGVDFVFEAILI